MQKQPGDQRRLLGSAAHAGIAGISAHGLYIQAIGRDTVPRSNRQVNTTISHDPALVLITSIDSARTTAPSAKNKVNDLGMAELWL